MCAYCPHTSTEGPFLRAYSAVAGSTTIPRHERVLARVSGGVAPSRRRPVSSAPPSATTEPSPQPMSSASSASPCPLESVGAHTPAVLTWFTWWGGRRSRGMVLCPRVPPIRSVFQSGMRCSMVLMTVLASIRARAVSKAEATRRPKATRVRPSDEEAPVSDRYDGPQTVRAGPRSDPDDDRADDGEGRRALSRRRPCYRRTRHPVRRCSPRWCGYRRSHG
jgi:hypothetical protein